MNQVSNSTIQRYISNLKRSWINEKNSPELLPYENSIDIIRPMIVYQQNRIDQAELYSNDNANYNQLLAEEYKLQYPILQLGLDRIKYIVASYLRIRINKIDKNVMYYLSNSNALDNLSQHEKNYALKYVDLLGDGFNEAFINHIPEKLSNLTEDGMIDAPDLDKYVLMRVLKVPEDDEDQIPDLDLAEGQLYAIKYSLIKNQLLRKNVELL